MFSFCSMPVETIGQAFSYGWRVTARCAAGKQDGMSRHKECVYRAELDMETLVWTRGKSFPLSRLESRLRCPICGSRDVVLLFSLPTERQAGSMRKA
jgi:hypothetical protein